MKKQNLITILIILIILASVIPIICFVIKFGNQLVSDNTYDWSNFGSYVGGTSAALTIPLSLLLLVSTYKSQRSIEVIALETLANQKFEKRFFELFNIFNEFRYRQLEIYTQEGDKEKVYYRGIRFFIPAKLHLKYINSKGKNFRESYLDVIKTRDISFEFYFRCLDNLLYGIEEIPQPSEKQKLLHLISNSLGNDEKFFIKYFDYHERFKTFKMLEKYRDELIQGMYFDYTSILESN